MLEQIIVGIIGMAVGAGLVVYARRLVESFGTMATAEERLGSGGTYTALRILGIFIFVVALLYMIGYLDDTILRILKVIGLR